MYKKVNVEVKAVAVDEQITFDSGASKQEVTSRQQCFG